MKVINRTPDKLSYGLGNLCKHIEESYKLFDKACMNDPSFITPDGVSFLSVV